MLLGFESKFRVALRLAGCILTLKRPPGVGHKMVSREYLLEKRGPREVSPLETYGGQAATYPVINNDGR